MQMTKLKYGTKTYYSKVPLRFIKITVDILEGSFYDGFICFIMMPKAVTQTMGMCRFFLN